MPIKFGPAGMGPVKEVEKTFEQYKKLGISACEIPFVYGVYIKKKEDAEKIRKESKKAGIQLSIHAPYWINLNSKDKSKIEKSKERILKCLEVGTWLEAKKIVFHPGYYLQTTKEETFSKIKKEILDIMKTRKEKNYTPELAPETTGKINVFGSIDEIARLVRETKCSFCIDFAHILAREKKVEWDKIEKLFPQKDWHCHFSGIEFGEKGERYHKKTEEEYWEFLLKNLPKEKNIVIINESPEPVEDSAAGAEIYKTKFH